MMLLEPQIGYGHGLLWLARALALATSAWLRLALGDSDKVPGSGWLWLALAASGG